MSTSFVIDTKRLHMQPVTDADLPECEKLYGDPDVVALYENGQPKSPRSVAQFVNEYGIQQFQKHSPLGLYSVFLKTEDRSFIGQADFFEDPDHPGAVEPGYILHKRYHGQGYGSEIGAALKQYAYELKNQGLPIRSLIATAHPNNIASWRILEKMGMSWDGVIVNKFGNPRKVYVMDL